MTRFPLYLKILLWFFLNLLVLGLAALAVVSFQFRLGPELLVAGPAGERVRAVADIIRDEINVRPRTEWNDILQRFGSAYHVRFLVYRGDGTRLAGEDTVTPPEVMQRVQDARPGGRRGPPSREREPLRGGPDFRPPPDAPDRPPGGGPIRFVLRTTEPKRYWIGVGMPVIESATQRGPGTLVLVSDSWRAGGLLMDLTVWVWVGVGAVIFSILFWLPLVGSITRSLAQMNHAAAEMAEGKFDIRVSEKRRDELGSLGRAINRMAARLAGFVTGQKRFTGDIAHELCSPIARMQMAVGILEDRADPKDKPYVDDLREEVQHMSALVNELLSFSKASLGAPNTRLQTVPLRPLVERAVRREAREGADLRVEVADEVQVLADPELIVRAVSNLLRNAVHYAGTCGPITVTAQVLEGEVELIVADSGAGVPEEDLPKLFDPFFRVDTARARETGGVGLGLSIVKTCVESCHGSVTCWNGTPSGFAVAIRLPS